MEEYKFVTDDDGNWYLILVSDLDQFYYELEQGEDDNYVTFNSLFSPFRSRHPTRYAFTSWREM